MSVFIDSDKPNTIQRVLLVAMGVFIPPLPIYLLTEPNFTILTTEFWISVVLTLLGHVPGVLFAVYFVLIGFDKVSEAREGYIVIGDEDDLEANPVGQPDLAQQPAVAEPPHQDLSISKVEPPQTTSNEPEPPRYEDIVGHDQPQQSDSKQSGDHKVQT